MRGGNSVPHLEHWALFRAAVALVVHARGGNIGVTEHLLHFRQIRAVFEGVGRGRRSQTMRSHRKTERGRIFPHQLIHPVRRQAALRIAPAVMQGTKQRAGVILAVAGGLQIVGNESIRGRM